MKFGDAEQPRPPSPAMARRGRALVSLGFVVKQRFVEGLAGGAARSYRVKYVVTETLGRVEVGEVVSLKYIGDGETSTGNAYPKFTVSRKPAAAPQGGGDDDDSIPFERQRGHDSAERSDLLRVVRQRERVAKSGAARRAAELVADFEQQLATEYSWDDDKVWREAHQAAREAAADAQHVIAARCAELGIPEKFAPELIGPSWYQRGENAVAARRTELRRVATTRIAALEKGAKAEIEHRSLEVQERIIVGGLASAEARAFLDSIPAVDSLMPPLRLVELEASKEKP